jgi:hypothetical protein
MKEFFGSPAVFRNKEVRSVAFRTALTDGMALSNSESVFVIA